MAKHVTRIKAGEGGTSAKSATPAAPTHSKKTEKTKKTAKTKTDSQQRKLPLPLRIITAPFRATGRYIRDSWLELRHVRWPSRSATWKMLFAVVIYSGLLIAIIMLLDALFTWLFNLILG